MNQTQDHESRNSIPIIILHQLDTLWTRVDRIEEPPCQQIQESIDEMLNLSSASNDCQNSYEFVENQRSQQTTKKNNRILITVDGIKTYICGYCERDFKTPQKMGGHIQKNHSKIQNKFNQAKYSSLRRRAIQKGP